MRNQPKKRLPKLLGKAKQDLHRRIFKRSVFQKVKMKDTATSIARQYAAGIPEEELLKISQEAPWLKGSRKENRMNPQGPVSIRRADKFDHIYNNLEGYLKDRLTKEVESFFHGLTTVEFSVREKSVELVGFFNEKRPHPESTDPFEDVLRRQSTAPYA